MANTISCPTCGSTDVECVEGPPHDHRCLTCGHTVIPCEICTHADETGSWVDAPGFDGMTHCRTCHQSWRRQSEYQHCTACHRTFTNVGAADMHRDGGRCLDPATVVTKTGKHKLQRSTRRMEPRSTIELWAQGGERPEGIHQSASEGS